MALLVESGKYVAINGTDTTINECFVSMFILSLSLVLVTVTI